MEKDVREMGTMMTKKPESGLKRLFLCFAGLCLTMSCASQQNMPVPEVVPPDESMLRVGVSTDAPPLISKQGEEVVGVEAELAREFAKFLGKSVRFIEIQWEDQIPALLDNRTDIIMSGMSITKARQFRIAFSEPYFKTGLITLVRKGDKYLFPPGYHGIYAQAIIRRIGIVKDTTGEFFVRKNYGAAKKISSFPTAKEAVDALKKNQIDLLIFDAPMVYVLAAENEWDLAPLPTFLTEEYLGWGIRKNDVELLESANAFIQTLRKDGRLTTIIKRWIPITE